jgi:RHS repeat-associated protein
VPTTTGFLGKHEDGSGLTHLEHRDYDPTTGVFITVDPLVASTGDPYSYAAGNPTTLSDPNGLEPCPKTGCSADDSGGRAPCARSAYSDPMATGACVPNSASYNAMLKYDEWSACVKKAAGCPATIPAPPVMPPMDLQDTARLWEDIISGFDDGADGGGVMFCAGIEGSAGIGSASAMTCEMVDTDGLAGLTTVGAGPSLGTPGFSGSAGGAISNADAGELTEWGLCGGATAGALGGGTGTLCGSIALRDGTWSYLGAWTFYLGVTITSPQASVGYAYTYTWVDRFFEWPWK